MKNSKIIRSLVALFLFLVTSTVFSQSFDTDVVDNGSPAGAPIDDYLILAALLLLLYVFYKMKKIGAVKIFSNENSSSN